MKWIDSVRDAIRRICARQGTDDFTRQELIEQELPRIVDETGSTGETPDFTLSRVLQELRDLGEIEFVNDRGGYRLLNF